MSSRVFDSWGSLCVSWTFCQWMFEPWWSIQMIWSLDWENYVQELVCVKSLVSASPQALQNYQQYIVEVGWGMHLVSLRLDCSQCCCLCGMQSLDLLKKHWHQNQSFLVMDWSLHLLGKFGSFDWSMSATTLCQRYCLLLYAVSMLVSDFRLPILHACYLN